MNLWLKQRKGITNRSNHLLKKKKKNQTNNGPFILGLGQWKLPRSKEGETGCSFSQRRAWRKTTNITTMTATTELYRSTEHRKWNYQKWVSHFLYLLRKSLRKWISLHLHLWTIFVSMPSKDLAFPLCSSLTLPYCISQFVGVNFLGHCDFLGLCSCRSFGVCLISIPLCYTQFRNIWKLPIVRNLILWKVMTTQPGFEHSYFQMPQLVASQSKFSSQT